MMNIRRMTTQRCALLESRINVVSGCKEAHHSKSVPLG